MNLGSKTPLIASSESILSKLRNINTTEDINVSEDGNGISIGVEDRKYKCLTMSSANTIRYNDFETLQFYLGDDDIADSMFTFNPVVPTIANPSTTITLNEGGKYMVNVSLNNRLDSVTLADAPPFYYFYQYSFFVIMNPVGVSANNYIEAIKRHNFSFTVEQNGVDTGINVLANHKPSNNARSVKDTSLLTRILDVDSLDPADPTISFGISWSEFIEPLYPTYGNLFDNIKLSIWGPI